MGQDAKQSGTLQPGTTFSLTKTVTMAESAGQVGSGNLDVFGTPSVVAFVEETAWKSVAAQLADGQSTVGTHVDISHTAPTPIGMQVTCKTKLVAVDRRKLSFEFTVRDEVDQIAHGTHERFIIDTEKFLKNAVGKGKQRLVF